VKALLRNLRSWRSTRWKAGLIAALPFFTAPDDSPAHQSQRYREERD